MGIRDKVPALTFFGGAGQIGGNKILLEDRDTRVFLDFGEPFHFKDQYFIDYLMPRDRCGLKDMFFFDLMPRIRGLYDEDWLECTEMKYGPPAFDAIFVSHMHFDHAMHLRYADRKIPVHLGFAADKIRESWCATGSSKTEFGDHDFKGFRTGSTVKVGSMEIQPIHVDHSVPGAYGFIIHTSEGAVVYTGDLRLHGPRSDMTKEFVREAVAAKPIALITEGTRVSDDDPRENLSEKDVEERAKMLLAKNGKFAMVSFYPKDVDRMRTFRDVARATGRKFVVSTKVAHLLMTLASDPKISVPDPMTDPNMLVYARKMSRPVPYDKEYCDLLGRSDHVVDSEYVRKHQREIIFHTDFPQLTELVDIGPEPGSTFIRSKSEPFEEDDAQDEVLMNWVSFLKLDFQQAHASGHASMEEIFGMVKAINPGCVVPVHTEHPELFTRCSPKVRKPEPMKRFVVA